MRLKDSRLTILIGKEGTEIELHDRLANVSIARIKLTPEQLSACLSRQGYVECECEVYNFDKVGKKHECQSFEFEISEKLFNWNNRESEELLKICQESLVNSFMADWKPDRYFNSQNSFFKKDGRFYARTTIRRYVEVSND